MAPGGGHWPGRRRRGSGTALLAAASYLPGAAAGACGPRFNPPGQVPSDANHYNGAGLTACFHAPSGHDQRHHVFVIGDWGGEGNPPRPVDRRGPKFPGSTRKFVHGVDDCAQQRVAAQMKKRALRSQPDYVLNVGDNFYWGGIQTLCGARPFEKVNTGQWGPIYEDIYRGPGLDGKQWLGVLGNHDYGGFTYSNGWDQVIGYSWGGPPPSTNRWMTPAQFWSARAQYPDFSVDYFFLDTNVFNVFDPHENPDHNICSLKHTPATANCGHEGPKSVWDCPLWFRRLWRDQIEWLNQRLGNSTADWQVCVTHFPPTFGRAGWERLVESHGVDLIVTGHIHQQEVHYMEAGNFLRPTAWIVSGGGGGITSEGVPDVDGADDQYGFFDLQLSKEEIVVTGISHGGQVRSTTKVHPRAKGVPTQHEHHRHQQKEAPGQEHPSSASGHDDHHDGLHDHEGHSHNGMHQDGHQGQSGESAHHGYTGKVDPSSAVGHHTMKNQSQSPPLVGAERQLDKEDQSAALPTTGGAHSVEPPVQSEVGASNGEHGSGGGSHIIQGGQLDEDRGAGIGADNEGGATQQQGSGDPAAVTAFQAANTSLDYALFIAGCVAFAAVVASIFFGAFRVFCVHDRPRKDNRGAGSSSRGWASSGYSGLSGTGNHTDEDADERTIVDGDASPEQSQDEYGKPNDVGCFCWPNRRTKNGPGGRYQLLQPA